MSTGRPQRLKDGETIGGRYRIDGTVGKGGFGAVYKATQLDTGVSVALKVLLANYSTSETDSKRFKREAALVKGLSHPNIVQLLDFGQTDKGVPYIAFELLEGEALNKQIERIGPLPIGRNVAIAMDVLRALQVAHEVGIIHRDVKPQNVFLVEEPPWTKVLDFGIAKAVKGEEAVNTQLTESGQMVGTPHYMAPEQVRGTGVFPASDLYAVGLVMAEMATGERVIKADALIEVYMAHISDKPLPIPQSVYDSPIGPIIAKATNKAVDARYASAAEMLAALETLGLAAQPREAATVMMGDIASRVRASSGNAFALPRQPQGLTGTVMMEATPDGPVDLDATVNMPPRRAVDLEHAGPASGTLMMGAHDDPPASDGRVSAIPGSASPGSGARAMTALPSATPTAAQPSPRRGSDSLMSLQGHTAQPSVVSTASGLVPTPASLPATASGMMAPLTASASGRFSAIPGSAPSGYTDPRAPAWPTPPPQPPTQPARKSSAAIWIVLVLVLLGSAIGVWLWAPWR